MSFAFELEDVVVRDGGRTVLDRVTFAAVRGEPAAIVGPVGCGKTTLLRVLAGTQPFDAGKVRVLGDDLRALPYEKMRAHRLRVGFAFESTGLLGTATIGENVGLPLRYHRPGNLGEDDVRARVLGLAEELGFEKQLDERAVSANASVRKRAMVARALVLEPEILLADEPQVGLTQKESQRVSDAFERRRHERGMTLFVADHDGWFDPYVISRIWYLEEGKLSRTPTIRPSAPEDRMSDPMPEGRPSLTLGDIYGGPSGDAP